MKYVITALLLVVSTLAFCDVDTLITILDGTQEVAQIPEKKNPGVLFWVSCAIAGILPWVIIYFMKQKQKK